MVGGIALLGTVTATLASWLVEAAAAEKEQAEDLQATVRRLEAKVCAPTRADSDAPAGLTSSHREAPSLTLA
jgi:hypothetical protein